MARQTLFEAAIRELVIDDPSLAVRFDAETQTTVLEACGELHVEIIRVSGSVCLLVELFRTG